MQSANSLLDNISLELFTKQPTHLLLAFGPTASRPSEVYSLAFPAVGKMLFRAAKCCCWQLPASMMSIMDLVPSEHCSMAASQKAMDDVARRLIRTLVMNTQDMPEGKASAGSCLPSLLHCHTFSASVCEVCKMHMIGPSVSLIYMIFTTFALTARTLFVLTSVCGHSQARADRSNLSVQALQRCSFWCMGILRKTAFLTGFFSRGPFKSA